MHFFHSLSNRSAARPAWATASCHLLAQSEAEGSLATGLLRYNHRLKLAQRNSKEAIA